MVIQAGFGNTFASLYELVDQAIDGEVKASVRKHAQRALANIPSGHEIELRDVSGIKSGQNYLVDLELVVPGSWTVDEVKTLEDAVRTQVGAKVRGVRRIRVRFISQAALEERKFDEFIPGSAGPSPSENEKSK
jgi:divalent metal cation (Fe/Co/Zn/Cd) transporter